MFEPDRNTIYKNTVTGKFCQYDSDEHSEPNYYECNEDGSYNGIHATTPIASSLSYDWVTHKKIVSTSNINFDDQCDGEEA